MKSKLISFNQKFILLLEDGSIEKAKAKETQGAFQARMEMQIPDLQVQVIGEAEVQSGTLQQIQALATKHEGNLYGELLIAEIARREAPSTNVAEAKAKAKANQKSEADRLAERKRLEAEKEEARAARAKQAALDKETRDAEKAAEKAAADKAKAEAKSTKEAEKAAAKEAKEAEKLAAGEAKAAEKLLLRQAKETAKALKAEEAEKNKEVRAATKKAKAEERAQARATAKQTKFASLESKKYSKETIAEAVDNIGRHLKVIAKDRHIKYEGLIVSLLHDPRNGTIMYEVRVGDAKMRSVIDSLANVIE